MIIEQKYLSALSSAPAPHVSVASRRDAFTNHLEASFEAAVRRTLKFSIETAKSGDLKIFSPSIAASIWTVKFTV